MTAITRALPRLASSWPAALLGALLAAGCASPGPTAVEASIATTETQVLFFDGAEDPQAWSFLKQSRFQNTFPTAVESPVVDAHPLAAGWHVTDAESYEGSKSWTMVDEQTGGYHGLELVTMTSPPVDATGFDQVLLAFAASGSAEEGVDLLWALASRDGTSWEPLGALDDTERGWRSFRFDLTSLASEILQVRFQFTSDYACDTDTEALQDTCGAGPYRGFYVDDITVTGNRTVAQPPSLLAQP